MTHMPRFARAGFTLAEILIAIVIVAIMAMVAIPAYNKYQERAQKTSTTATLKSLRLAIQSFNSDTGQYPELLQDLMKRPLNEDLAKDWNGPYLEGKDVPKDGWKHPYQYQVTPGGEHEFALYSYGPKGKTAAQADWISIWNV